MGSCGYSENVDVKTEDTVKMSEESRDALGTVKMSRVYGDAVATVKPSIHIIIVTVFCNDNILTNNLFFSPNVLL